MVESCGRVLECAKHILVLSAVNNIVLPTHTCIVALLALLAISLPSIALVSVALPLVLCPTILTCPSQSKTAQTTP